MSRSPTSPARATPEVGDRSDNDDRVLGSLLLLIGGVRVAMACARHEVFATEATVALLMVAVAIGLLVRSR